MKPTPIYSLFNDYSETSTDQSGSWTDLQKMVKQPQSMAKNELPCITPHLTGFKTKESILATNRMTMLVADIDENNLTLDELMQELAMLGVSHYITHSTSSSMRLNKADTVNGKKWRVFIQLATPVDCATWMILQEVLVNLLHGDSAMVRVTQFSYAPNNPTVSDNRETQHYEHHIQEDTVLSTASLPVLLYDEYLKINTREKAFKSFKPKVPKAPLLDGQLSVINIYNERHSIEDELLARGDTPSSHNNGGKWLFNGSTSGKPGISIKDGKMYSHGNSDPLADGFAHDAFDVMMNQNGLEFKEALNHVASTERVVQDDNTSSTINENNTAIWKQHKTEMLISDHVFIKPINKFYNLKTGVQISPQAFNQAHTGELLNPGDTKPASAAITFKARGGDCVDGLAWLPHAHNVEPKAIVRVKNKTMVNTYVTPEKITSNHDTQPVQPYLEHLEYLIPDSAIFNVFISHLAHTVQYPNIKINWQILAMGKQGIGKDMALIPIARYFGDAYQDINTDDTELNKWGNTRAGKKVLTFQEVHRPKDTKFSNELKTLAANTGSETITLNLKGGSQIEQANLFSVYAMSNYPEPMHISPEDRRWYVISMMEVIPKGSSYYDGFYNWLVKFNGWKLVIAYLLAYPLRDFNIGRLPEATQARIDLIENSYSDNLRLIEDLIMNEKSVFRSNIQLFTLNDLKQYLERNGRQKINTAILSTELAMLGLNKSKQGKKMVKGKNKTVRPWINPNYTGVNYDLNQPSYVYDAYQLSRKNIEVYNL